jgi:hypothetical protein
VALTDSLISHWALDEASGNALDSHSTNDLTETSGTIASATGKIGNCRDFESGDTEYFEGADSAALSTGDIDFTWAMWVQGESAPGSDQARTFVAKWGLASNQREYTVLWENLVGTSRFRFYVSSNGTSGVSVIASTFGTPSVGTWYFIVAWHDAAANTINIQINNGTVDSASHSAGVRDGTAALQLGTLDNLAPYYHDGLIDEVSFWKRLLTADERTALYNGGNGLAYPWASGGRSSLVGGKLVNRGLLNRGRLVKC